MGVVFLGEDPKLGRKVAIKAMLPDLAESKSAQQRFLREARAAAVLEHDHIVAIHHVGEDHGTPFIVMPFLKGEALDTLLKRGEKLSLVQTLRIGREIAEGLAAAHELGLVHRDIKPANIWLEARGAGQASQGDTDGKNSAGKRDLPPRVKVLDFGLARATADSAHLTQSGAIIGTPAYMAPEQANGQAVDARSDLFSLGCLLYRVCTDELPFQGTGTMDTLIAVVSHDPPPPHEVNPAVPHGLSDLVMKLLAKAPADRPASAAEVAERLGQLEQRQPAPPESPARPQKSARREAAVDEPTQSFSERAGERKRDRKARARRRVLAGAAVLLLALGAAAVWIIVAQPAKTRRSWRSNAERRKSHRLRALTRPLSWAMIERRRRGPWNTVPLCGSILRTGMMWRSRKLATFPKKSSVFLSSSFQRTARSRSAMMT